MLLELLYDYFIDCGEEIDGFLLNDLANYLENSGVIVKPIDATTKDV